MSLDIFILVITAIANTGLGLLVLLRNYRDRLNIAFFLITSFMVTWTVTNYLTDNTDTLSLNLLFARYANLTAFQAVFWIMIFANILYVKILKKKINYTITVLILIVGSVLPFLKQTIIDVTANTGVAQQKLGPLYLVLIMLLLFCFARALYFFIVSSRRASTISQKAQLHYLAYGFTTAFIFSLTANAIIPSLTGNWEISRFGPIFTTFVVAFTTYTIIRHRLFDIRLVVARALAYVLLLSSMVGVYALAVFVIASSLINTHSVISQQVIPIAVAIFLALTAQPLKRFFDHITNKVFYRDAYDPQTFLDQFNKEVVSTIDLERLLTNTAYLIGENIKSEFCAFSLEETHTAPNRLISNKQLPLTTKDLAIIQTHLSPYTLSVNADLLSEESKIKKFLLSHNIAYVAKLVANPPNPLNNKDDIGYLFLGPKKSGNPYNTQDARVLSIIANGSVIAIQNALRFEEIEHFNITLQQKVNNATKQLRQTNEKLKALDESKDEFISMASHQLRTPLTSMKGYVSMVLEGDAGKVNTMQKKLLDQAFASSQRMVYLIADLLNVSRLRTGKFVIEPKPTDLSKVVESEVSQLKETAQAHGLELTYNKPDNFPVLNLDETKIRQVIMNFIDNAIYYTPSGGHVSVSLDDKGQSVELTVTDDGLGVPAHEQRHLFTKFYRAGNARKARPDGTGLGLFMAKKVVLAQGGAIIFKSQEGKGSTFGFTFAKAKLKPSHPD